jgi:inhibitor of KinA
MQTPRPLQHDFQIYALSEQAVTLEFGDVISSGTLKQISSFNKALNGQPFPGFKTAVPAYTTLTVYFDPLEVMGSAMMKGLSCFEKVSGYLSALGISPQNGTASALGTVIIPVCYGGAFGPDLAELAGLHNLSPQEVISLHTAPVYEVYMIGFVPGFAYLGGLPQQLATPRKLKPRAKIPAGSVGIAGAQTGIYPLETPGGWQIIGRTPLQMFNTGRQRPSLLKAGDRVAFKPVEQEEFNDLTHQ